MKWLSFGLLVASFSARAQEPDLVASANVVVVLLADSGSLAWDRVGRVLEARGHHVQLRDPAAQRMETEARFLHGARCMMSVTALVLGPSGMLPGHHSVLLSGSHYDPRVGRRPQPLYDPGYPYGPFGDFGCVAGGWDELRAIAHALGAISMVTFRP